MSDLPTDEVTRLLLAWSGGDAAASDQLLPLVYDELRHLARGYMGRERGEHTLQPTALVHEAYLRLVDATHVGWQSRGHFFGIASRLMRQILVDHARERGAIKRGGLASRIPLEEAGEMTQPEDVDFVALDQALEGLVQVYPRQSEVVELKFFGGLTIPEISEALQISERTVQRDWEFAQLWLKREMHGETLPHEA